MRQRSCAEGKQSGFTLLELLIVITILGLILVALTSGVRFAGQAWQVQQRRTDRAGDLDAVQNVLRQLIISGKGFDGDASSLRFVSPLPASLQRGGLYDVDLHVLGGRLLLAWRPHFKGPSQQAEQTETELTKGAASIEISYYMTEAGWQNAAHDKAKPPSLIRIELQFDDTRPWPPLIVAPMVDVQPSEAN